MDLHIKYKIKHKAMTKLKHMEQTGASHYSSGPRAAE